VVHYEYLYVQYNFMKALYLRLGMMKEHYYSCLKNQSTQKQVNDVL
jgi:hypothetical protein